MLLGFEVTILLRGLHESDIQPTPPSSQQLLHPGDDPHVCINSGIDSGINSGINSAPGNRTEKISDPTLEDMSKADDPHLMSILKILKILRKS